MDPPPSHPRSSSLAQAAPTQFQLYQQQHQQQQRQKDKQPVKSPPVDAPPTKSPRSIMPNLLIEHRLLGNPPVINSTDKEDEELDLVQIQEQQRKLAEMQAKLEVASQRLLLKQQQQQQMQEEKEPEQALLQPPSSITPSESTISLNNDNAAGAGPGKKNEGTVEVKEGQPSKAEKEAAGIATGGGGRKGGRKRAGASSQSLTEYQIHFRTEYERLKRGNPDMSSEEAISIASKSVRERARAQTTDDSTIAHILDTLPSTGADLKLFLAQSSLLYDNAKGKAENKETAVTRAIPNKNDDGDVSPPEMIFPTTFDDIRDLTFHSYMRADEDDNNNSGGNDKFHKEAL